MVKKCKCLTAGAPSRGTEYAPFLLRNTTSQDRTLYFQEGQFVLVQRYDKARNVSEKERIVPKFLPRQVSQIVANYYCFIRPLENLFNDSIEPEIMTNNMFAPCGNHLEGAQFRRVFSNSALDTIQKQITVSVYRQIAAALIEKHCGSPELERSTLASEQFAHSHTVHQKSYATSQYDFRSVSRDSFFYFSMVSSKWHELLSLSLMEDTNTSDINMNSDGSNGYDGSSTDNDDSDSSDQSSDISEDDNNDDDDDGDNNTNVGDVNDDDTGNDNDNADYESADSDAGNDEYALSSVNEEAKNDNDNNKISDTRLLNGLQKFLKNPQVQFSQHQKEIFKSMFSKRDQIIVQRTGFGKSLCFFLPCVIYPHLLNVVIVPLTCLLHDLMHRSRTGGIACREWKQNTDIHSVSENIVFVSVELAGTPKFREFLKVHEGRIGGIYIDEVHLYKTWSNFRSKLENIKLIREINVPLILMSGTVPIAMEKALLEEFKLASSTIIHRGQTNRAELEYSVYICRFQSELYAKLTKYCKISERSNEKLIIFCPTKAICKEIHDMLTGRHLKPLWVTSELSSCEKKEKLEKWKGDEHHLMVATSALAYGVDVDVHCVIHCGAPHSFIDYAQECGRAGRSGKTASCKVLITEEQINHLAKSGKENQGMIKFLTDDSTCRRKRVNEYLDGKELICSNDMAKCDVCSGKVKRTIVTQRCEENLKAIAAAAKRTENQRIENVRKVNELLKRLDERSKFCMTSYASGGLCCKYHPLTKCVCGENFWKYRCFQCGSKQCRKNSNCRNIIFKGIKSSQLCFMCYLPESAWDMTFHQPTKFGKQCESKFIDQIWPLCIYLFHSKKGSLPQEVRNMSLQTYIEWLLKLSNGVPNAGHVYTSWSK